MSYLIRSCVVVLCGLAWLVTVPFAQAQAKDPVPPPAPAPLVDPDLQKEINAAVDKGVALLKRVNINGMWQRQGGDAGDMGSTALAAWTLLESGVDPNDPIISKAAAIIRFAVAREQRNYNLSLYLIFLDRLGDPQDEPLIEACALRLMQSQMPDGGWTYNCNMAPQQQEQQYLMQLAQGYQLKKIVPNPNRKPRTWNDLSPQTQQRIQQIANMPALPGGGGLSDASNTQFAMIALWVAGRHGIPIGGRTGPIARVETRFRRSQWQNGAWMYYPVPSGSPLANEFKTPAMTCAGLLGLALAHAIDPNRGPKVDILKDNQVHGGLVFLEKVLAGDIPVPEGQTGKGYYFLWTLERMAVVYDLKRIGKVDWYQAGAKLLVSKQGPDGSWQGDYAQGGVDTCFALLFLKKVNIVGKAREEPVVVVKVDPKKDPVKKVEEPIGRLPSFIPEPTNKPLEPAGRTGGAGGRSSRRSDAGVGSTFVRLEALPANRPVALHRDCRTDLCC